MNFNGEFKIEDVTVDEVWLALSDPVMIRRSLPGCEFLVPVDGDDVDFDELRESAPDQDLPTIPEAEPETVAERTFEEGQTYAALVEVGVGSIKPSFETLITIDRRSLPTMEASGKGSASNSSFEMQSAMTLVDTDDGVLIEWEADTDVFGRVAQLGNRVMNPVANQVVGKFFGQVEEELSDVAAEDDSSGLTSRIRSLVGSEGE